MTGAFIVLAAWLGVRAAARINAKTAKEIEVIKAEGQRNLERDKYRRDWRRERSQPMIEFISKMASLSLEAELLDGKDWHESDALAAKLLHALLIHPTRGLL